MTRNELIVGRWYWVRQGKTEKLVNLSFIGWKTVALFLCEPLVVDYGDYMREALPGELPPPRECVNEYREEYLALAAWWRTWINVQDNRELPKELKHAQFQSILHAVRIIMERLG